MFFFSFSPENHKSFVRISVSHSDAAYSASSTRREIHLNIFKPGRGNIFKCIQTRREIYCLAFNICVINTVRDKFYGVLGCQCYLAERERQPHELTNQRSEPQRQLLDAPLSFRSYDRNDVSIHQGAWQSVQQTTKYQNKTCRIDAQKTKTN